MTCPAVLLLHGAVSEIPPEQPSRVHFVIEGEPVPLRRHRVANNRSASPVHLLRPPLATG